MHHQCATLLQPPYYLRWNSHQLAALAKGIRADRRKRASLWDAEAVPWKSSQAAAKNKQLSEAQGTSHLIWRKVPLTPGYTCSRKGLAAVAHQQTCCDTIPYPWATTSSFRSNGRPHAKYLDRVAPTKTIEKHHEGR